MSNIKLAYVWHFTWSSPITQTYVRRYNFNLTVLTKTLTDTGARACLSIYISCAHMLVNDNFKFLMYKRTLPLCGEEFVNQSIVALMIKYNSQRYHMNHASFPLLFNSSQFKTNVSNGLLKFQCPPVYMYKVILKI